VVTFASGEDSNAVLCGLTITGGQAQNGGGIYIDNACPVVEHNIIEGNAYEERGGGIYREQGVRSDIPSLVRSNVIRNNIPTPGASNTKGGGIYITRANTVLHDNLIEGNEADRGAGIYIIQANPDLVGNWIVANTATVRGGGIYCQYGNPIIVNNMIANNVAGSSGGGINCYIASPHLIKTTIVDNGDQGVYITRPVSAQAYNASHATFNSCVIRGHTQQIATNNGGEASVAHSNIEGGHPGEGNMDCDPLYDDDYCLPPESCCTNTGDPALPLDGDGSTTDIGYACDFSWAWDEIQSIYRDPLAQLIWNIRFEMPGIHSQGFRTTGEDTLAVWWDAIEALKSGLPESCSQLVGPFGYELINDEIYAPDYWILRELPPVQNGWGTFIYNKHPDRPGLQVHVNHPIYDFDSHKVGLHALRSLGAEWFLMAGTHRFANCTDDDCESDMARNQESVFQAVFEATSSPSTGSLSFHAFSSGDHDGDFLVALSNGSTVYGDPNSIVVSPTIEAAGIEIADVFADPDICCVATPTNGQCDDLGATKNPQGLFTNIHLQPGHWLSVESAVRLTSLSSVYEILVAAIGEAVPTAAPGLVNNRFMLANYPNPFNPATTIYFNLLQPKFVNLAVFAIDGRRIRTLLAEQVGAGYHEVLWDGQDAEGRMVSSGTYFCRIETGGFVETKRMMLVK
jgi:hypothetical protein